MADPVFDQARSEAFAGRMMDVLNGAGITLMLSIGHQVGLFDTLADLPPPASRSQRRPGCTSATCANGSGR